MIEPVKVPVLLTTFGWHIVLKILENELNTVNAGRFTGIPQENVVKIYELIASQLANPQEDEA